MALNPGVSSVVQSGFPGSAGDDFSSLGKRIGGVRRRNAPLSPTNPSCSNLEPLQSSWGLWSESCRSVTGPGEWRSLFLFALSLLRLSDLWRALLCKRRRWITTRNGSMSTAR